MLGLMVILTCAVVVGRSRPDGTPRHPPALHAARAPQLDHARLLGGGATRALAASHPHLQRVLCRARPPNVLLTREAVWAQFRVNMMQQKLLDSKLSQHLLGKSISPPSPAP